MTDDDVTISLSLSEQNLLLANEMNDHPGWTTIAEKIRRAERD